MHYIRRPMCDIFFDIFKLWWQDNLWWSNVADHHQKVLLTTTQTLYCLASMLPPVDYIRAILHYLHYTYRITLSHLSLCRYECVIKNNSSIYLNKVTVCVNNLNSGCDLIWTVYYYKKDNQEKENLITYIHSHTSIAWGHAVIGYIINDCEN